MTLEQVKKDIESGKSKMIFYSAHTLWWTHLKSDLKESTKLGKERTKLNIKNLLEDNAVHEGQKKIFKAHLKGIEDSPTPLDPTGSPILQTENCDMWIKQAEENPEHFGDYGLESFMKVHHQNCDGWIPLRWNDINQYFKTKKLSSKDEEE